MRIGLQGCASFQPLNRVAIREPSRHGLFRFGLDVKNGGYGGAGSARSFMQSVETALLSRQGAGKGRDEALPRPA